MALSNIRKPNRTKPNQTQTSRASKLLGLLYNLEEEAAAEEEDLQNCLATFAAVVVTRNHLIFI